MDAESEDTESFWIQDTITCRAGHIYPTLKPTGHKVGGSRTVRALDRRIPLAELHSVDPLLLPENSAILPKPRLPPQTQHLPHLSPGRSQLAWGRSRLGCAFLVPAFSWPLLPAI